MTKPDDAAAAFYEDPANREFTTPAQRRRGRQGRLTKHVPIRFSAETLEQVQLLAQADGVTVSGWIRNVIKREVKLKLPRSVGTGVANGGSFEVQRDADPAHRPSADTATEEWTPDRLRVGHATGA